MPLFLWIIFADKSTGFFSGCCVWCSTFVFSCVVVSWRCSPQGGKIKLLQTTESLFGCIFRVGMALFFFSWHLYFFLYSPYRCSPRSRKDFGGDYGGLVVGISCSLDICIFFHVSLQVFSAEQKRCWGDLRGTCYWHILLLDICIFFLHVLQVFPAKQKRFWGGLRGTCYWHILLVVMALFFVSKSCSSSQFIMCRSRFRLCGYVNVDVDVSVPYYICVIYFCASRICVSKSCFSSRFSMCRSRCRLCGYVNIYAGM